MKSVMPYRGITSGELTALLRPLLNNKALALDTRETWESAVLSLWDNATHREDRYAATALLEHRFYRRWVDAEALPLLQHLIVTGAWWDHVDRLAAHPLGSIVLAQRDTVTPLMLKWTDADDMWLRRSSILCQLRHKESTDLDLLTRTIDANLDRLPGGGSTRFGHEFFIRKAIGWALRQHARVNPVWVRTFVADRGERLSGLSRREALKHLG